MINKIKINEKLNIAQISKLFMSIFKMPFFKFFNPILKFDIVQFDEWLGTPDNVSCAEYVEKRFGVAGKKLIERILEL